MGQEIVYCSRCQTRLRGDQARRVGAEIFCLACAPPAEARTPVPVAPRATQRRIAAAKRRDSTWLVATGAASLVLVVVIVAGVTGRPPPPSEPLPRPPAPAVQVPPSLPDDPGRRAREESERALAALDTELRGMRQKGDGDGALALLEKARGRRPGIEWEKAIDARLRDVSQEAAKARAAKAPPKTEPGLLVWLKLDEGQGDRANDSSGGGRHGTLVKRPAWVAGKAGGALGFDGQGSRVEIPDGPELSLTGPLTVAGWVNPSKVDKLQRGIIEKWESQGGNAVRGYYLRLSGDAKARLVLADGQGHEDLTGKTEVPLNAWTHLAGVYDGTAIKIYVNGRLDRSGPVARKPADGSSAVAIGASPSGGNRFVGVIDEVRIYNRALSDAEVASIAR